MSHAFSNGVDNVLWRLRHRDKEGRSSFPHHWKVDQGRIATTEPIHNWFVRCVDEHLGGDIGQCKVAENLAFFAVLHWRKDTISYMNCQALVTIDASLEDFYCKGTTKAQYLRLDYDLRALGSMFREPAPHVHVHPDGEPRFPFFAGRNVVIDFLDFIYRNYQYENWLIWAETVWKAEAAARKLDVLALDRVKQAFDAGSYESVKVCKVELDYMKRAWRRAKDVLWPFLLSDEEISILSYEP